MNYYPFHLGDYLAATAHLSETEDLVYRRLIDQYYLNEGPIAGAPEAIARRIRMRGAVQEVTDVLAEFFTLRDGLWHQKRCDEELALYGRRVARATKAISKRWGSKPYSENTPSMPQVEPEYKPSMLLPPPRITNHNHNHNHNHNQIDPPPPAADPPRGKSERASKRGRATAFPADMRPNETHAALAKQHSVDLEAAFASFRDYSLANGKTYIDWDAGFNNWIRNSKPSPIPKHEQHRLEKRSREFPESFNVRDL